MIAHILPAGKLKVFTVTGVANDTTLLLRPDEGTWWKLIAVTIRTSDNTTRTLTLSLYNGTTAIQLQQACDVVNGTPIYLNSLLIAGTLFSVPLHRDVWLTHAVYLRAVISALTATKQIFFDVCAEEVIGLEARA